MDNKRIRYIARLGENLFERLCIDSHLTASPPKHDENGWDAFVEFPLNALLGQHRDGQPAPMKCLVQVKATDQTAGSAIDMSISNWERMAQSIMPVFIAIFYIEGKDDVQILTLSHFDNACMYKTLQRIRTMEKAEELNLINHRTMSFCPKPEDFMDWKQKEIFKRTVYRLVGNDFGAYAEQKALTRREIGFTERAHKLKFSSECAITDVVDAVLGLKEFEVKDLRFETVRFGIALEDQRFSSGLLRLMPQPSGSCKLIASSKSQNIRANLDAQIFIPYLPGLDLSHHKTLVTTGDIKLEFFGGGGTFSVDLLYDRSCTLDEIYRETQFLTAVAAEDAKMQIQMENNVFQLNLTSKTVKGNYFTTLYTYAGIIKNAVSKTTMTQPINLRICDLTTQSTSISWFACVSEKRDLTITSKSMALQLPERIPKLGYFATSIWMKFDDRSLVLLCFWRSKISRNGFDLCFRLGNCKIFEAFWATDPFCELAPIWPRFRDYCQEEAGSAPLLIFGPPEELGSERSEASLHMG